MERAGSTQRDAFRHLPSVEEVLHLAPVRELEQRVSREVLAGFVRERLAVWRGQIAAGALGADEVERRLAEGALVREVAALVEREAGAGLVRAVNATGVVLHTGLGRAPVHPEAARAMEVAAKSYCVLEVDRATGERNERDQRLSQLLVRLTGAEAAIAVNNNAAAVLLALSTFAGEGRETIVSRGELVEIGGSFRMPDVCARAGTHMVEVGTTNRTRIEDYERAITPCTGLLLKVHRSNFRIEGFTESAPEEALAQLGRSRGVPTVHDLGSGLLEADGAAPLAVLQGEPLVRGAVASGLDVVTFSGDKLLGGPQAGLLVGHAEAIARLRKNALYRALRLDKVAIAGLEKTLELLLTGRGDEIPARAMLLAGPAAIAQEARALAELLAGIAGIDARVAEGLSQPGSGSAPGVYLPTAVVRVQHRELSAGDLVQKLLRHDPPVFARIQDGALLLDPRTLLAGDLVLVVSALRAP